MREVNKWRVRRRFVCFSKLFLHGDMLYIEEKDDEFLNSSSCFDENRVFLGNINFSTLNTLENFLDRC